MDEKKKREIITHQKISLAVSKEEKKIIPFSECFSYDLLASINWRGCSCEGWLGTC